MNQRSRRPILSLLLLVPLILGACSDDATGPGGDYDAQYALVSVNGETVPVMLVEFETDQGTIKLGIQEGALTLSGDRYSLSYRMIVEQDGIQLSAQAQSHQGTFEVDGASVTFTPDDVDVAVTGSISGDQIAVTEHDEEFGSVEFIFHK